MSVLIDRSLLSKEDKIKITKELTILLEKGSGSYKKTELVQCYLTTPKTVRLPLSYAVNVLNKTNDNINHFRPEIKFIGSLREHQNQIFADGLVYLAEYRSFTLVASTGAGKTVMGARFACKLNCITCVLIDRKPLIGQWEKTFEEFTDGKIWIVGDEDVPDELPNIIICMNLRIGKIPEWIRKEIGLLIIDEAHKFCTKKQFERMMIFNPIYMISMTATPNKPGGEFEIIHKFTGDLYIKWSENKIINVHRINTPLEFSRVLNKQGNLDWPTIEEELHYHPVRNSILINLVLNNLHRKIMIFSGRKNHVDMVILALRYYGVSCDYMSGNKKSYSDSNVLVGTTSKIGYGFDEATFCSNFSGTKIDMVVIFNSYKSLIQLEQNIGRSRSSFPSIYHFVDKDSIIYRQWLELRKFYLDPECSVRANISAATVPGDAVWPFDITGEWVIDSKISTKKTDSAEIISFPGDEANLNKESEKDISLDPPTKL